VKKLLIATILVLSCAECFSQDLRMKSALDSDPTAHDILPNHSIWFDKTWEFDVTNYDGYHAKNTNKEKYHVVIETGDSYKWQRSHPKKSDFDIQTSSYKYQRLYEVWIPATVQVSLHNNPAVTRQFDMMLKSTIWFKKSDQVLCGRLVGSVKGRFWDLNVNFSGGNETVEANFFYSYFPPTGSKIYPPQALIFLEHPWRGEKDPLIIAW